MTIAEWKTKQIALAWHRVNHYWELIQSLEKQGKPPSDPVFDVLADHMKLEFCRVDVMEFDDNRFYYSSDNDLEWS